jgi:hypothetical protein
MSCVTNDITAESSIEQDRIERMAQNEASSETDRKEEIKVKKKERRVDSGKEGKEG